MNLSLNDYPDWILNNPKVEISGGNIKLYHYGEDNGTGVLQPEYFGKNSYTSDAKQWSKPRVMFYVHPSDREQRVRGNEFIVWYPLEKLYPFNSDPLYYYEECSKDYDNPNISVGIQLSCISDKADKNQFDGMILKWENSLRVDIWKPVKVEKVTRSLETSVSESLIRNFIKEMVQKNLNESGFSRLKNIINGQVDSIKTIAIITAENPEGVKLSNEENNIRNDKFKNLLKNGNFGYIQIKGKFGNTENPFFIMNIKRDEAIKFGKYFNQESIIFGYNEEKNNKTGFTFEYIEGDKTLQKRYVSLSGKDIKNRDDYYSEYKGRKFLIPFFDDEYNDKNLVKGKIMNNVGALVDESVYNNIIKRVNYIINEKSTGTTLWNNRGMIKEILKENNAYLFD